MNEMLEMNLFIIVYEVNLINNLEQWWVYQEFHHILHEIHAKGMILSNLSK